MVMPRQKFACRVAPAPIASAPWTMAEVNAMTGDLWPPTASPARAWKISRSTTPAASACWHSSTPRSIRTSSTRTRTPAADLHRRPAVVPGQHPLHDGLSVAHRYLALHRPHRRRPLRRLLRAQPRAQRLPRLPRPHVRPPLRGCLPPQGDRRPNRHLLPEARRLRLPRRDAAGSCAAVEWADRRRHRRWRQRPDRRAPARPHRATRSPSSSATRSRAA